MPGRLETTRVCDICGLEPAGQHTITHNHRTVEIDLCADHLRPLEDTFERYVLASTKAPGYSTSPYRCVICKRVLSRRVHAAGHVQRVHGYTVEESYAYIRPAGERVPQVLTGPSHRPHRCLVCQRPYVNRSTARRHVREAHPERLAEGQSAADLVRPIDENGP